MDPLTLEEIEELCRACVANAAELLEEAAILVEIGRPARAYFLARIAFEEIVKPIMLTAAGARVLGGLDPNWSLLDKALKEHPVKGRIGGASLARIIHEAV